MSWLNRPPAQGLIATGLSNPSVFARNGLLLSVNAKRDYGASGSSQSTTGTMAASSTTLTLAVPIDFVNGQGINVAGAGASGALLVTSIVSGAGTTTLTLATAASTAVSAVAVNHDDTAAITDALSAVSGGGVVVLDAGEYCVTSDIILSNNNMQLIGLGNPTIFTVNGFQTWVKGNYCKIQGITFDGKSVSGGYTGIIVNGSSNQIIGNLVQNHSGHGINLDGSTTTCLYNYILFNECGNNTLNGIGHYYASQNFVIGNYVHDSGQDGITCDNTSDYNFVAFNRLNANCAAGGDASISMDDSDFNRFIGNIVTGTLSTLGGIINKDNVGPCGYVTISDNVFEGNGGPGITLYSGTNGAPNNWVVEGNTLRSNASPQIVIASQSVSCYVGNNPGYNPVGSLSSPAVPASGIALTNPFSTDCTVAVTDSGTGTSVAVGGITVATIATGATVPVRVGAGQSITLTYSTTPTWAWTGH